MILQRRAAFFRRRQEVKDRRVQRKAFLYFHDNPPLGR